MTRWFLLVAWGLGVGLGIGCKGKPSAGGACPPEPDFVVTVEPSDVTLALPEGTTVRVDYGGTLTESYELGSPVDGHEVLFCETSPHEPALGAGGAPAMWDAESAVHRVTCRVWTSGPARVTVTAIGYDVIAHDLKPDPPACTVLDTIQLGAEAADEE